MTDIEQTINAAWENSAAIDASTRGEIRDAVDDALARLDAGTVRVAEKLDGEWVVNQWLKKAVLLSFRLNAMTPISGGPGGGGWWDKVPSKFATWSAADFDAAGLSRGAVRRRTALCLHRARRRADAEFRQRGRVRRQRHDDRHVGNRRLLRADWSQLPHLGRRWHRRRPGTATGRPGHHRRQLFRRGRAPRWPKASSSKRVRCFRWAST